MRTLRRAYKSALLSEQPPLCYGCSSTVPLDPKQALSPLIDISELHPRIDSPRAQATLARSKRHVVTWKVASGLLVESRGGGCLRRNIDEIGGCDAITDCGREIARCIGCCGRSGCEAGGCYATWRGDAVRTRILLRVVGSMGHGLWLTGWTAVRKRVKWSESDIGQTGKSTREFASLPDW
jgi:hypothetical protein